MSGLLGSVFSRNSMLFDRPSWSSSAMPFGMAAMAFHCFSISLCLSSSGSALVSRTGIVTVVGGWDTGCVKV